MLKQKSIKTNAWRKSELLFLLANKSNHQMTAPSNRMPTKFPLNFRITLTMLDNISLLLSTVPMWSLLLQRIFTISSMHITSKAENKCNNLKQLLRGIKLLSRTCQHPTSRITVYHHQHSVKQKSNAKSYGPQPQTVEEKILRLQQRRKLLKGKSSVYFYSAVASERSILKQEIVIIHLYKLRSMKSLWPGCVSATPSQCNLLMH